MPSASRTITGQMSAGRKSADQRRRGIRPRSITSDRRWLFTWNLSVVRSEPQTWLILANCLPCCEPAENQQGLRYSRHNRHNKLTKVERAIKNQD